MHLSRFHIPETDGFVVAARSDDFGVRHPSYSGYAGEVTFERMEVLASTDFPNSNCCVSR